MGTIFLSYKREDEGRASRLARELEAEGFELWWDRHLPGGENWRAQIAAALDRAKVVIVCWTRASTGSEGGFVRDEAGRAGPRILPVLLEAVKPPLGFGEVQAIDLSHWRGNSKDPFFRDLVEAIRARLGDRPAPTPAGPARRALSRWIYGGGRLRLVYAGSARGRV
jgi:hypothetical protein